MRRFLQGDGEVARRIRACACARDRAATPLGPPEAWPAPLRTVTATCGGPGRGSEFEVVVPMSVA